MIKNKVRMLLFRWELQKLEPVLVYQMGKVASTSIYESLKRCYNGIVIHTHIFDQSPRTDIYIREIHKQTENTQVKPKIISLVREPIGRNVSAFFQNFLRDTSISPSPDTTFPDTTLQNLFIAQYKGHNIPASWFDNHILKNFNIDVFSRAFPEQGWDIYHSQRADLLVIKSEILDSEKALAITEFLQLPFELKLRNFNISEKKVYSHLYDQFKSNIKLPESYLNDQLNSKYFKHFYSEGDKMRLLKKWSANTAL